MSNRSRLGEQLLKYLERRCVASHVTHKDLALVFVGGSLDRLCIGAGERHGLFDKDVIACLRRLNGTRRMILVAVGNEYKVNVVSLNYLGAGSVDVGHVPFGGYMLGRLARHIADGGDGVTIG